MATRRASNAKSSAGPALLRIALLGGAVLGCLLAVNAASQIIDAIPTVKSARLTAADYQRAREAAIARSPAATEGWLQLRVQVNLVPALLPGPKATIDLSTDPPATQPTIPARRAQEFQTAFQNLAAAQQQTKAIGPLRLAQAALILSQLETIEKPRPWWPYIRPNLSGIDASTLKFEMNDLRQAQIDAYVSLGISAGAAAEYAEEFIGAAPATLVSFLAPRLAAISVECESSGDAECATTVRKILLTLLRRMVLEDQLPAIRLVAADQLARVLESDLGKAVPGRAAIIDGLRAWRRAYHVQVGAAPAGPLTVNMNAPSRALAEQNEAARAITTTLWLAIVTAALGVGAFLVTLLGVLSRIAAVLARSDEAAGGAGILKRGFVVALVGTLLIAGLGFARAPDAGTRADDIRQVVNWKLVKTPPPKKGQGHWLSHYRVSFVEPAITAAIVAVLAMRFGWLGRGIGRRAMAGTAASVCISVMLCGISTASCSSVAISRLAAYDEALARATADSTLGLAGADAHLGPLRGWTP
ncbi:MAG: hypothetical protein AMXMBFR47_28040 [Planctomycetota bacterium]